MPRGAGARPRHRRPALARQARYAGGELLRSEFQHPPGSAEQTRHERAEHQADRDVEREMHAHVDARPARGGRHREQRDARCAQRRPREEGEGHHEHHRGMRARQRGAGAVRDVGRHQAQDEGPRHVDARGDLLAQHGGEPGAREHEEDIGPMAGSTPGSGADHGRGEPGTAEREPDRDRKHPGRGMGAGGEPLQQVEMECVHAASRNERDGAKTVRGQARAARQGRGRTKDMEEASWAK